MKMECLFFSSLVPNIGQPVSRDGDSLSQNRNTWLQVTKGPRWALGVGGARVWASGRPPPARPAVLPAFPSFPSFHRVPGTRRLLGGREPILRG